MTKRELLAVLMTGILLLAAWGSAGAAGVSTFDASLGLGGGWNDNVFQTPDSSAEEKVAEAMFTLVPKVSFSWEERKDRLRLSYRGEYWSFQGDRDDSLWLHDLYARLDWRRIEPFFLEVSERRDTVPRMLEKTVSDLFDLLDRNNLSARGGFAWAADPTLNFELALSGQILSYPGAGEADETRRYGGQAVVKKRWSPFINTGLRLDAGKVERTRGPGSEEYMAGLDWGQRLAADLDLSAALNWRMNDTDGGGGGQFWLKRISLTRRTPSGGWYRLGYDDSLTEWYDGRTALDRTARAEALWAAPDGSSLKIGATFQKREFDPGDREETAWGPAVDARWVLVRGSLALDLGGTWKRIDSEEGPEETTSKIFRGTLSLIFFTGDRFQFEAGYNYINDDSGDPERSFDNNRVWGMVTVYFQPNMTGNIPDSNSPKFLASTGAMEGK